MACSKCGTHTESTFDPSNPPGAGESDFSLPVDNSGDEENWFTRNKLCPKCLTFWIVLFLFVLFMITRRK